MNRDLKKILEKHIEAFIAEAAEHEDWPEEYSPPCLGSFMEDAAAVAFDAVHLAAKQTERENAQ